MIFEINFKNHVYIFLKILLHKHKKYFYILYKNNKYLILQNNIQSLLLKIKTKIIYNNYDINIIKHEILAIFYDNKQYLNNIL